ncbi:MAG: SWIM zinc finger family protein [Anaerolineales bacterium]|nr:SWIM zinc finger family protein [Anaerolineales bacterium]
MARRRRHYNYYFGFEPTRPIETEDGIKARSKRGAFAKSWWATRWIEAMERLVDSGRLSRGRSYARRGQVLSIDEKKSAIEARVQGSRSKPYKVTIRVEPLDDAQWEKVIDALAERALFTAQLLAGEMPADIDEAFKVAGTSLFPTRRGDLETNCSCPDWSNPCKHVAATHYILGERFDEDPFLLFRLRGRGQEQILQALRQRRAEQDALDGEEDEPEQIVPLEETLERFWVFAEPLAQFSVSIKPPVVEMPLLQRLGEPSFVPDPGLQSVLRPAYQEISRAAIALAIGEDQHDENGL